MGALYQDRMADWPSVVTWLRLKDYYYRLWLTNDRPDLSSVRAPHIDRTVTFNHNKDLVMSPRRGSTPRQTDWLTVSRKVTLTLTLTRGVCWPRSMLDCMVVGGSHRFIYCLHLQGFDIHVLRRSELWNSSRRKPRSVLFSSTLRQSGAVLSIEYVTNK
jgi:hypothetical protein